MGKTISGGDGDDTITVNGTVKDGVLSSSGARSAAICGDDGNDTITVGSGGSVTGYIDGGDGKDTITIESGGTVTGDIYGGTGADTITLAQGGLTVYQGQGDSGDFTPPTSGNTVSTADFDVVDLTAASNVNIFPSYLQGLVTPLTAIENLDLNGYGDQALFIQGEYDSLTASFTANGTGTDYLLAYDCDTSSGIDFEAVVIVGSTGVTSVSGSVVTIS